MELVGILLAVPVTLVASLVYSCLIIPAGRRWPLMRSALLISAGLVGFFVVSEMLMLAVLGAKESSFRFGRIFTIFHFVSCVFAPPAVAHLAFYLSSRWTRRISLQFITVVPCCWLACMVVILGHIAIDEAIVGPDAGRPFYFSNAIDRIESLQPTRSGAESFAVAGGACWSRVAEVGTGVHSAL